MSYFENLYNGGKNMEDDGDDGDKDYESENNSSLGDKDEEEEEEEEEPEVEEDEEVEEEEVEEEEADDDEEEEEEEEPGDEDVGKGNDSELEEGELDSAEEAKKNKKKIPAKKVYKPSTNFIDDDDDDDDDGEQYLQKFDHSVNQNYILNIHPESVLHNYDEILSMTKVFRDTNGTIIDKLHRTIPFLTKYEKSRILGQRAKQINSGAYPFVKVPENVIDGYIIAELELKQQRIPFIIRRPLPNGGSEYWKVKDLEDISF